MLDESTPTTDSTTTGSGAGSAPSDSTGASGTPSASAPRKRTAKKASGDAAPAKKAAKKAATKTTATRTAKKSADRAATSDAPAQGPASTTEATAEPGPRKAAAKKAAKKSAAKKTATKGAEAASTGAGAAHTPVGGLVLFQAPEPVAAPARSRSRKATEPASDGGGEDRAGRAAQTSGRSRASGSSDGADSGEQSDSHEASSEEGTGDGPRKRRRRGGRGRRGRSEGEGSGAEGGSEADDAEGTPRRSAGSGRGDSRQAAKVEQDGDDEGDDSGSDDEGGSESSSSRRRRRRRRRSGEGDAATPGPDDPPNTVVRVRERRPRNDEITGVRGSTRLEAKKQRRREGREQGRRKQVITEAEFLARRESVERVMVVRQTGGRTQIGVLEDDVLVEHYVSRDANASMAGNVYLGRVQNVLPSMEAAFVDIGKGRNAVLYAGEVNWDAAGVSGQAKRIENVLKSGESVLVQVTKDPIGHKGARLTSQISLPGRYLVYVPEGSMTGISRKLPENERTRLKQILKAVLPEGAGVIVRTAAEGASEDELRRDVERLTQQWEEIQAGASGNASAPSLLHGEPDLTVRVIRDVFNEDFAGLVVSGDDAWQTVESYVGQVAPDLSERVSKWTAEGDIFSHYRIDEQLAKALDRKVWLPSGGSLVIDRTEAMTVVDVNTGKFTGSGGNLEETVTKNNIEAAEEIVRQLRLRDVGGIIVIDFIDMVLESNRELVLRRLLECLGRDRTKHQVAEVTSLGLVQMTRKRVGQGLLEVFSETCEVCHGRGVIVHTDPVEKKSPSEPTNGGGGGGGQARGGRRGGRSSAAEPAPMRTGPTAAEIAARAHAAAMHNAKLGEEQDGQEALDAPETSDEVAADEAQETAALIEVVAEAAAEDAALQAEAQEEQQVSDAETDAETEPETEPEMSAVEPEVEPEPEPVAVQPPPRRRRGRATAPAGPPPPAV
jgi:ribonuclease E